MRRGRGHEAGQRDRKTRTNKSNISGKYFQNVKFFCSKLGGHQSCPSALTFSLSLSLTCFLVCAQLTVFAHGDYLCLPAFSIPPNMKWSQKPPRKDAPKLPCLLPNGVYNFLVPVWSFKTVFINNSENRCLFISGACFYNTVHPLLPCVSIPPCLCHPGRMWGIATGIPGALLESASYIGHIHDRCCFHHLGEARARRAWNNSLADESTADQPSGNFMSHGLGTTRLEITVEWRHRVSATPALLRIKSMITLIRLRWMDACDAILV